MLATGHLPVVLPNAAARRCLFSATDSVGLIETSFAGVGWEMSRRQRSKPRWPCCRIPDLPPAKSFNGVAWGARFPSRRRSSRWPWLRAAVGDVDVRTRVGLGDAVELPESSGERRLLALTEACARHHFDRRAGGKLHYVSAGVRNSLGYTSEERQSSTLFEHVHPDDLEGLRVRYQQLVDGEIKAFSYEFRVRHKDGSYRCLSRATPLLSIYPSIGGAVNHSRDITERKMAEQRLPSARKCFAWRRDAVDGVIYEWDVGERLCAPLAGVLEVVGGRARGSRAHFTEVGGPLDCDTSTTADSTRTGCRHGIALTRLPLRMERYAPNVSNAIRGGPARAAEQAQHGRFFVRLEIARSGTRSCHAFGGGLEILGSTPNTRVPPRAVHIAAPHVHS